MAASARALGFDFDPAAFDATVDEVLRELAGAPSHPPHRLRVALSHDGRMSVTHSPLPALPPGAVRLRIAPDPLPAQRPLAGHKTTLRAEYDAGIREAEAAGAFDTLFFGAEGQLVEGGRTSVFLRLDGRWYTPPLADGVLPGVMRGVLLEDPSFDARERRLSRADLERAEGIVVCNALRGARQAFVDAVPAIAV
jgi:para-aminobenzoate synthetase/4-amino-4-deoxychorismate lyase